MLYELIVLYERLLPQDALAGSWRPVCAIKYRAGASMRRTSAGRRLTGRLSKAPYRRAPAGAPQRAPQPAALAVWTPLSAGSGEELVGVTLLTLVISYLVSHTHGVEHAANAAQCIIAILGFACCAGSALLVLVSAMYLGLCACASNAQPKTQGAPKN